MSVSVSASPSARATATRSATPGPMVILATLCIALPILPYVVVRSGGDAWQMGPSLALADFALIPLALVTAPVVFRRLRSTGLASIEWALILFSVVTAATCAFHPSLRGLVITLRLVCVSVLAMYLRCADRSARRTMLSVLSVSAIVQCVIAVGEQLRCGPVGLGVLGETAQPFRSWCQSPSGTTRDAYVLAAFATFAAAAAGVGALRGLISPVLGGVTLLAGGTVAGLSISRAAALTVVVTAVTFVVVSPRRGTLAALALCVGFAATSVALHDRWIGRKVNAATAANGTRTDDVSNGRGALTRQALSMIADHPLTGVGPGNYSTALRDDPELVAMAPASGILPVHNTVLLVVAESGIPGAFALALVLGLTVWAAVRRQRIWLPLLAAVVPYAMLDIVYWFFAESFVLLAIAIGLVTSSVIGPDGRDELVEAGSG